MISLETALTFFMASVILALVPGPDNIFVLTQSALYGKASGLWVTLGLCTGLIVHTSAVALGVAVIFQVSAVAFSLLKIGGACYLLYLAWHAFRASATRIQSGEGRGITFGKLYRRGIIMNVTNPKVSIFFLAFLPQFADPERGALTLQIILLGFIFILSTVLIFGSVALLAGALGEWLNRSSKAQLVLNKVAGTVFIGLALKLITAQR
ncbi:MAG: LysE family translocator [Deltaproteobacteria bacterium]|nr:LysE family translocator [Deltaproteobacteria bacterium]